MPSLIDNHILSQLISGRPPAVDLASLAPEDWSHLLRQAHREGVGPLLYWQFSNSGKLSALPGEVRSSLRAMYASTWAQNQKLFEELAVLARLFQEKNIPLVALKGACFALTIYPDIGLRPMADLDVLVPNARLAEAVGIAKSLGYVDAVPEQSPGLNDLVGRHVGLQKSGMIPISLEIHNRLVADKSFVYAVPVDWFWEQTERLNTSSPRAGFEYLLMLTPAAQLLYAASHIILQHGSRDASLRWYYDVDQLIHNYGSRLDWDLLLRQAQVFHWGSALKMVLSQTQEYFSTPIPEAVCSSLVCQVDELEQVAIKKQTRPMTLTLQEYQNLSLLNWQGRAKVIWALLFPSPAYMRWRYKLTGFWSLPVYYPLRWWGIAKDALHTVAELLKRQFAPRT